MRTSTTSEHRRRYALVAAVAHACSVCLHVPPPICAPVLIAVGSASRTCPALLCSTGPLAVREVGDEQPLQSVRGHVHNVLRTLRAKCRGRQPELRQWGRMICRREGCWVLRLIRGLGGSAMLSLPAKHKGVVPPVSHSESHIVVIMCRSGSSVLAALCSTCPLCCCCHRQNVVVAVSDEKQQQLQQAIRFASLNALHVVTVLTKLGCIFEPQCSAPGMTCICCTVAVCRRCSSEAMELRFCPTLLAGLIMWSRN
jgi:hypothetical protein